MPLVKDRPDNDIIEKYENEEIINRDELWKFSADIARQDIHPDTFRGRPHLVVPVVALKEEVLKGQFLPGEVLRNSEILWNDVPVPVTHPKNVSAREKRILEDDVIGRLLNVRVEDKKLKGDLYLDKEFARMKGGLIEHVYDALDRGESMDVSTSYWADTINKNGSFKGQKYKGIQVNIRPDHLAILPDKRGELSRDDGVGVPIKNRGGNGVKFEKIENARSTARTPEWDDTSAEGEWSRETLTTFARIRGWDGIESVDDLTREQRRIAANSSLLGVVDAETWGGLTFFQVVSANGTLYKTALASVRGGRGQSANIPESAFNSADRKAKQLLQDVFGVDYPEENMARHGLVRQVGDYVVNKLNFLRGENMDRKQKLVNKLLNSDEIDITEGKLLDTDVAVLETMAEGIDSDGSDGGDGGNTTTDGKKDNSGDAGAVTRSDIEDIVKNSAEDIAETAAEKAAEKIKKDLESDKRESLINKLSSLDAVVHSKEELEEMPTTSLEKINNRVSGTPNYFGQSGAGGGRKDNGVEVYESKKVLLEKGGDE